MGSYNQFLIKARKFILIQLNLSLKSFDRYAASNSNHAAAKKDKVDWNSIHKWREKQEKLEELKQEKSGGGKR